MSKGDNRRQMRISQEQFAVNWDQAFEKDKKKTKSTKKKKKE